MERMQRRFDPNQMPRDPNQMQRMMADRQRGQKERIKEALQATETEWKVLEPKVTKVLTLSRQTGGIGGMGMPFRRPGWQGPEMPRDQTPVGNSLEELQKVLENKDAKPEEIKAKLTALRDAREKAQQELAKAQKELSKGLTPRQEAQLVLMGYLN
jgi:hypothetical protein